MSGQVLESLHDVVSAEHPTYIGGGTDIMPQIGRASCRERV